MFRFSKSQKWVGLKIAYCEERGNCVIPTCDVPSHQVICDYPGRKVDFATANAICAVSPVARAYAVDLPPPKCDTLLAHGYEKVPSFGPLLNHSGRHPNCKIYIRDVSTGVRNAKKVPMVMLKTTKRVAAGEELTWDYGDRYERTEWIDKCNCSACTDIRVYKKLNVGNHKCFKYTIARIHPYGRARR